MAAHDFLINDTIAAIATGMMESGIGIIRISGPKAPDIACMIFRNRSGQDTFHSFAPGTIHFGYIVDQNEIIDEVMISFMKAPHSYTTEDTVEINTHGGIYLMNRILSLVLSKGARLAEPGEFTKRAFLGGRIDLSRAEAVMDLIGAENEFARKTAVDQLNGILSEKVRKLRKIILHENAFIESALDDPDNYSLDGYPEQLADICGKIKKELEETIRFSEEGRILKEGIRTVIVGKPNAGKSSLMNYLSGTDRAIVTDIPGTTRDTLQESVRIDNLVLHITDTAGIHKTDDQVEKIGVEKAKQAIDKADLILFLIDTYSGIDDEDKEIAQLINQKRMDGTRIIMLLNKSDLPQHVQNEEAMDLFRTGGVRKATYAQGEGKAKIINYRDVDIMAVSMTSKEGLDHLKSRIKEMFRAGDLTAKNEVFLSNLRQLQEAKTAASSIDMVISSIQNNMPEDFYTIDLMNAYTSLGRIIGEAVEDDLVEEIFSSFCMGK